MRMIRIIDQAGAVCQSDWARSDRAPGGEAIKIIE
jgi:hypothetical protein